MLTWLWRSFHEFTVEELYAILAHRQNVFVLEQKCLYPDIDHQDQQALHLLGLEKDRLIVYLRMFPPGTLYPEAVSFGRFLILQSERHKGHAQEAMQRVLAAVENYKVPLVISAQPYLQKFYNRFDFKVLGEPYDEDGIPHIKMVRGYS